MKVQYCFGDRIPQDEPGSDDEEDSPFPVQDIISDDIEDSTVRKLTDIDIYPSKILPDQFLIEPTYLMTEDIEWTEIPRKKVPYLFYPRRAPGNQHNFADMSELEAWDFLTADAMRILVGETNRYARQCERKKIHHTGDWKELTAEEARTFIALYLLTGVVKVSKTRNHWSVNNVLYGNPVFRQAMSRDRFLQILHYLHLVNNDLAKMAGWANNDSPFRVIDKDSMTTPALILTGPPVQIPPVHGDPDGEVCGSAPAHKLSVT